MTSDEQASAAPAVAPPPSRAAQPPPGLGEHERELVRRVSLLIRTLSTETQVYADLVCRLLDIHRSDLSALGHLERARVEGEPMTQADLGRAMRMSGAAITALADRLERTGHVERRRSDLDRRKILLATTEHARHTGRESFGPLARATRDALERYSDDELELVGRVLSDLVEASRSGSRQAWEDASAGETTEHVSGAPKHPEIAPGAAGA